MGGFGVLSNLKRNYVGPMFVLSTMGRLVFILAYTACSVWGAVSLVAPVGTEIHVRLKSLLSSNTAKAKDAVEAVVVTPVVVNGAVVVPAGTIVRGQVSAVQSSLETNVRAALGLSFTEIVGTSGKKVPMKAQLVDVDNARESVDGSGKIVGILASETMAGRIDQGISKVSQRNTALADLLEAAKGVVLKQQPSGEIRYEPGVELQLRLLEPLRAESSGGVESESFWHPQRGSGG